MDVLVAYDIADTQGSGARRLRDIADVCSAYGTRTQLSVFECRVTPARLAKLLNELVDVIDPRVDCVHVYQFRGRLSDSRISLGVTKQRELGEPWLL